MSDPTIERLKKEMADFRASLQKEDSSDENPGSRPEPDRTSVPESSEGIIRQVIFYNNKGGTGKTTLAVHAHQYLMFETTAEARKTHRGVRNWLLIDDDSQLDGYSWTTDHEGDGHIQQFYDGRDRVGFAVPRFEAFERMKSDLTTPNYGLLIDAPPSARWFEERMTRFLDPEIDTMMILPVVDRHGLDGAKKVTDFMKGTGCRCVIVFNQSDPNSELVQMERKAAKTFEEEELAEVFPFTIPSTDRMREAVDKAAPIWDLPWGGRTHASKSIRRFCQWIHDGGTIDGDTFDDFDILDRVQL